MECRVYYKVIATCITFLMDVVRRPWWTFAKSSNYWERLVGYKGKEKVQVPPAWVTPALLLVPTCCCRLGPELRVIFCGPSGATSAKGLGGTKKLSQDLTIHACVCKRKNISMFAAFVCLGRAALHAEAEDPDQQAQEGEPEGHMRTMCQISMPGCVTRCPCVQMHKVLACKGSGVRIEQTRCLRSQPLQPQARLATLASLLQVLGYTWPGGEDDSAQGVEEDEDPWRFVGGS